MAMGRLEPLPSSLWQMMSGIKAITVNRDMAILKAISSNPLHEFRPISVDVTAKVRYLSPASW